METQRYEGGSIPSVNSQFLCQNKLFGASDNYMYINTTDPHKLLWNTRRASVIKNSLYINFDSNVNILNCVQAEVQCFRCAKSAHTRFVCASIITDKRVPNARLLYVTIIVFTLITIVIHQNLVSATLASFIQPRAVVCVSYAHAAVGCFETLFSLYFTQRDEKRIELLRNTIISQNTYKRGGAVNFHFHF